MHVPVLVKIGVYLVAFAAVLILIDQLFLWFERRGWMYWRKKKRPESTGGRGVMGVFQEFVQPEIRHVWEDREQRKAVSGSTDPSDR